MGVLDSVVEVPRRTMVLFFLIDTSGSMSGSKIGTVNSAIEEVIPELKEISENNADAQIKIATLAFSTGARWIEGAPVSSENYRWNYLNASGVTDLGEACKQLNKKLSKKEFMSDATGSFAPAIFLLSDGEPTDDYRSGLAILQKNNWFKKAIRVAIAIGEDANKSVLAEFTGSMEAVITTHRPGELRKWIRFVSVTSGEVGSQNIQTPSETKADNLDDDGWNWDDWDNIDVEPESKQERVIDKIKQEREISEGELDGGDSFIDDGIVW